MVVEPNLSPFTVMVMIMVMVMVMVIEMVMVGRYIDVETGSCTQWNTG